jgi:UDP-glucose 4-epimerase
MNAPHGNALITGVSGFLGGHIAEHLLQTGWTVHGLTRTRFSAVYPIHALPLPSATLPDLLRQIQPSLLVHAAGTASVGQSLRQPYEDFQTNVAAWMNVLEAVRQTVPHCRLVLLSSASVYGNPTHLPIAETAAIQPISPYGFHKQMCELAAQNYQQQYGLPITIFRIFSAYGAGLQRQLLWDIGQKIRQGSVHLEGTGNETRDYIHGRDVAAAVSWCATHPTPAFAVYNLASGQAQTVRTVAEQLIARLAPACPLIFSGQARAGDPLYWQANIEKLSGAGFQPQIPFADGIAEYAAWLQHQEPV